MEQSQQKFTAIRDWQEQLRPREKLLRQGASALSDAELLAILFRTGVQGVDAVGLAQQAIVEFGSLSGLVCASQQEFCRVKGLGPTKYVTLKALMELASRSTEQELQQLDVMHSPQAVRQFLTQVLQHQPYEQFLCLHLDNQNRVLNHEVLFQGTIDSAAVYPRVVLDSVMQNRSAAVIFAHNHPSGIAEPSQSDIHLTERLKTALGYIDVRVLDHLVIGKGQITSFAERGLL